MQLLSFFHISYRNYQQSTILIFKVIFQYVSKINDIFLKSFSLYHNISRTTELLLLTWFDELWFLKYVVIFVLKNVLYSWSFWQEV